MDNIGEIRQGKTGAYCLEVCVDSVESAISAAKGGADRLELCSNLVIGGTTPGVSLFQQVRKACSLPIHVLLRPRYGDFLYTDEEFMMLEEDGRMFRELGADGIVVGCLRADGSLDTRQMELLRRVAGKGHLTLHRAFDMCRNPYEALEEAAKIGVDTILTSGQANTCMQGKELLGELARIADGRLNILAGGGVDEEAILCLGKDAGIKQFHLSGKRKSESGMAYRKQGVSMGIAGVGEYEQYRTDQEKIRKAALLLQKQASGEASLAGEEHCDFCGHARGGFGISKELAAFAEKKFCRVLPLLGGQREEILQGLCGCTKEEEVLMKFLYGTMPLSDAGDYSFELFLGFVRHSLMLARTMEWCQGLSEELFLHGILYPRINTEKLEDCRGFFYSQLIDRVKGLSAREAILEINYWCAENVAYESTDGRTASPMAVYRSGKGRCGEESVFAITAFRSMGIPARQAYVPRWAHCDDNHAWVEVYVDGKWEFLGACEPEEMLNRGWFTNASSRALIVHTGAFRGQEVPFSETGSMYGECCETAGRMVYENITSNYARTKEFAFLAVDEEGQPVSGAALSIEALNMAEYSRIALLYTDEEGRARFAAGLGDFLVHARKDGCWCEKLCSLQDTNQTVLVLKRETASRISEVWKDADIKAPMDVPIPRATLTREQKQRGKTRRKACALLRENRRKEFYKEDLAKAYPAEENILLEAAGNFDEIYHFLSQDQNPDRATMLHALARKDYKDVKGEVLESHLESAGKFRREWEEKGQLEIYIKWILCPRIYLEELTAYRQEIEGYFSEKDKEQFRNEPVKIWDFIKEKVAYHPELDYPALCATPCGILRLWWGNPLSQKILFVAICRTLGIPSRLNPVDKEAEFYQEGTFIAVSKASKEELDTSREERNTSKIERNASKEEWNISEVEWNTSKEKWNASKEKLNMSKEELNAPRMKRKGTVVLTAENGEAWSYYQNWSIAQLTEDGYTTLDYTGMRFQQNKLTLALDTGFYRLLTASRLPNGDQRASEYCFWLEQGGRKEIHMRLRTGGQKDMLVDYVLDDFQVMEGRESQKPALASSLLDGKSNLLAFLAVGQEPTEHVLNEMLEQKDMLNRLANTDGQDALKILLLLPVREAMIPVKEAMIPAREVLLPSSEALIPSKAAAENNTLQKVLAEIPAAQIAIVDFDDLVEPLARRIYVDPDKLPLLMALRPGLRVVYGCSGYQVGSIALIREILENAEV